MPSIARTAAFTLPLVLSTAVFAQPNPDRVDPTVAPSPTATGAAPVGPPMDRVSAAFSVGGSYAFSAGLEDSRGDVAVSRAGAELTVFIPASDKLYFSVGLTNEWSWYDFSGGSRPVVAGIEKPFSQVTTVRLSPGAFFRIDDRWAVLGGASADFSGETGADVSDAGTYGGFAGVRYRFSDRFSLTLGASARTVLEDDAEFLPIIGIDWQINDKWTFATRGPGLRLTYSFTPEFDLSGQVSYESRDYRLDDDSPIPRGVVRDQRVTGGLQAQWVARPWLIFRAETGLVAWGQIEFDNRRGDGLDSLTTDPTPYLGASVSLRF